MQKDNGRKGSMTTKLKESVTDDIKVFFSYIKGLLFGLKSNNKKIDEILAELK